MKNLYQRLSEENKDKLKNASKDFPTTIMLLEQFMQLNYFWSKIPIGDAMALHSALEPIKAFDLSTFINFFDNE